MDPPDGADLAAEDRHAKCAALLRGLEALRARVNAVLPQLPSAGYSAATTAAANEAKSAYEALRAALPLPVVATAARGAAGVGSR